MHQIFTLYGAPTVTEAAAHIEIGISASWGMWATGSVLILWLGWVGSCGEVI